MSLPRAEPILAGSRRAEELRPLLELAETVLRTWEPRWSGFLEAPLREEAEQRLSGLSELGLASWGGHPGAERRCLLLQRREAALEIESLDAGLLGLEISGNFLFDPAGPADLRAAILAAASAAAGDQPAAAVDPAAGVAVGGGQPGSLAVPARAAEAGLGDLWMRGDRGGQGIVQAWLARRLEGREGMVRSVPVRFALRPIAELQLPALRLPKRMQSVEASLRLDAVASAGFGLSRSRMADRIRQGAVRLDWQVVTSPSRELAVGERVQLEGRGELVIVAIHPTQRGRWRVEMERR